MSEALEPGSTPDLGLTAPPDAEGRFARLRERTDELELFISGLLAFALLAVPGRIFDAWATTTVHTEGVYAYALWFGFSTSVGLCYVVAVALIVHLAIRGYWVGLVGLKIHFPAGIRWDRIPFLGPVSRRFYQGRVGTLEQAIAQADRAASTLFSATLLFALTMVLIGAGSMLLLAVAGAVGALLGDTDRIAVIIVAGFFSVFLLVNLLPVVLEKWIARRTARGVPSAGLERTITRALRINQWLMPMRLLLPVQLTLQSNRYARNFMVAYFIAVMLAMTIGGVQAVSSMEFSLFNRYAVVTEAAVDEGMLSAHYESLRAERDQLLRYPMIPADVVDGPLLRLFIPHQPQRDNDLARRLCTSLPEGGNRLRGAAAETAAVQCVARFWRVTLDGRPVALDGFVAMERRDLEMRGVVGYLPLAALPPGRHDLRLVWNPGGPERGAARRRSYRIPFWYAPEASR
ncbi:hypothetical protein [Stenotrophomonas sp.]|uniref:hypothetical protein n=1 Tax=Stenotrophomonas sp. TaxID=69392 RepID=UPI002FCA61A1